MSKKTSSKLKKPLGAEMAEIVKKKAAEKAKADKAKAEAKAKADKAKAEAKAKADAEKAAAAKEKAKRGEIIVLAAERGIALADAMLDNFAAGMQKALGKNVHVTSMGLELSDGVESLSEDEFSEGISTLARTTDNADKLKASSSFALGDLCNLALASGMDGDEIIQQAVRLKGKSKHTVQEAMRIARLIPLNKRVPGLTFTHWQTLCSYNEVSEAKKEKILENIFVQEAEVVTPSGKKLPPRKEPKSCRELKEELQKAAGIKPASERKAPPAKLGAKYVFIDTEGGEVHFNEEFSSKAVNAGYIALDIERMNVLTKDGKVYASITQLPKDLQDEEVVEEPKKPEPAKPAKKKTAIPA